MTYRAILAALLACLLTGCTPSTPRSFTRTQSPTWSAMEIREDVEYERAWNTVFNLLAKEFDIEKSWRESGYIRTGWLYTWSGDYLPNYRVRVTVNFSPDRSTLQFLPEAQFRQQAYWVTGTDTRLISTLKTDLMGTIGRTTR